MSRRFSLAVAITAIATWVLVPGMAGAQQTTSPAASPVAVLPSVIERPAVLAETLPRTGSNLTPMIVMSVALMVLGVLLVMSVRRRQSDVTPA